MIVYLKSKYVWLRSIASLLLLFGYFLNVISFESFHQAVHNHDHAELHTEEAEANSCHRAIFHGEVSHNCEHKSHLIETESECQLCDVVVSRVHVYAAFTDLNTSNNGVAEYFLAKPLNVSHKVLCDSPLRGPLQFHSSV